MKIIHNCCFGSVGSADLYLTVLQDSIDLKATVTRRLSQLNFLARLPRTKDGGIVHGDNIPAIIRLYVCKLVVRLL